MSNKPTFECRLRVLNAVHDAPGNTMRERIRCVANQAFTDLTTGHTHRFTWRTISTWLYRHKKNGIATLENKTRSDKDAYRKVQVSQLAEAIHEVLPTLACYFPHSHQPNHSICADFSSLHRKLNITTIRPSGIFCA